MTTAEPISTRTSLQAVAATSYCVIYIVYLYFFTRFENEFMHWVTLVALPLGVLAAVRYLMASRLTVSDVLADVGLSRGNWRSGILVAVLAGLVLGTVQVFLSRQREAIGDVVADGSFIRLLPVAFLIMLFTAGFTEEFFFRGVLQTSLMRYFRRPIWSVLISGALFGLYHFPYAYNLASWPSHGDAGRAFSEGVVFSAIIGVVFGAAYARYKNLLVPVIMHSLFNAVWFMTKLQH